MSRARPSGHFVSPDRSSMCALHIFPLWRVSLPRGLPVFFACLLSDDNMHISCWFIITTPTEVRSKLVQEHCRFAAIRDRFAMRLTLSRLIPKSSGYLRASPYLNYVGHTVLWVQECVGSKESRTSTISGWVCDESWRRNFYTLCLSSYVHINNGNC